MGRTRRGAGRLVAGTLLSLVTALVMGCGETLAFHPDPGDDPDAGSIAPDGDPPDGAKLDGGRWAPEVVASDIGKSYAIVVSGGYVYYASFQRGLVGRVAEDGRTSPETIAEVLNPVALAIADPLLYVATWTPSGTGGLFQMTLNPGGASSPIDTCSGVRDVILSNGELFLFGPPCDEAGGRIARHTPPRQTFIDPQTTLAADLPLGSLAADATTLYWAADVKLHATARTMREIPRTLVDWSSSRDRLLAIAVDEEAVYARVTHSVVRVAKTAAGNPEAATTLAPVSADEDRVGLAVAGGYVYFAGHSDQWVARVPKAGGAREIIAVDIDGPIAIAIAGQWLYWTNGAGRLLRVRLE